MGCLRPGPAIRGLEWIALVLVPVRARLVVRLGLLTSLGVQPPFARVYLDQRMVFGLLSDKALGFRHVCVYSFMHTICGSGPSNAWS